MRSKRQTSRGMRHASIRPLTWRSPARGSRPLPLRPNLTATRAPGQRRRAGDSAIDSAIDSVATLGPPPAPTHTPLAAIPFAFGHGTQETLGEGRLVAQDFERNPAARNGSGARASQQVSPTARSTQMDRTMPFSVMPTPCAQQKRLGKKWAGVRIIGPRRRRELLPELCDARLDTPRARWMLNNDS